MFWLSFWIHFMTMCNFCKIFTPFNLNLWVRNSWLTQIFNHILLEYDVTLIFFPFFSLSGVFLALGCSGVVPVCHMLIIYGVQRGSQQGAVGWLIVMGLCYIIGAILYALRVPERFFPGRCNILVSVAIMFYYCMLIFLWSQIIDANNSALFLGIDTQYDFACVILKIPKFNFRF